MNTMPTLCKTRTAGALLQLCLVAGLALSTTAMAQTVAIPAPAQALPGDSVYQVGATLTDQNGHAFKLREHQGKPVLVSMFYSACKFVCPMLIDTMEITRQGLTPQERSQLDLLLITFDPEHDDVKKLKSIATSRALDGGQWTLARTDAGNARKIAATLGIQYRLLSDGDFNHTTVLVLLDGAGRIVGRTKKMGSADPEFIKQVKQTLLASSRSGS
jgi:protein SCO1/2